ncbi:MAG TPA: NADAR family protein [Candidatus Saccharibacteria bacterium]|nr:NADAR family protein [Candidatus Saccharibacteria bacterium]
MVGIERIKQDVPSVELNREINVRGVGGVAIGGSRSDHFFKSGDPEIITLGRYIESIEQLNPDSKDSFLGRIIYLSDQDILNAIGRVLDGINGYDGLLVDDRLERSNPWWTARLIRESSDSSTPPIFTFSDAVGDEKKKRLLYLDDWCVTGNQIAKIRERLDPTGHDIRYAFMALNPSFASADMIGLTENAPTPEAAGFSAVNSVSWGFEDRILNLVPRFPVYIDRPYKNPGRYGIISKDILRDRYPKFTNFIKTLLEPGEEREASYMDDSEVRFFLGPYQYLSNMSAFPVSIFDKCFPTSEHAYQWRKYRDVDTEVAEAIFNASSPIDALKIAQKNAHLLQGQVTSDDKIQWMKEIVREKVAQNCWIQTRLSSLRGVKIIEANRSDSFWGEGEDGKGNNHLGRIWEEIVSEYDITGGV